MTVQETNDAELERASDLYLDGASGDVEADQDDRETMANATHTEVENDELATDLNSTTGTVAGLSFPVYTGGNVVKIDEPLEMDTLVRDALDSDALFSTAGEVPPTDYVDSGDLGSGVDPAFLMEASKQTGEKFF